MNKVISEGIVLEPNPFSIGLQLWSSGDGTAGSPTYNNAANASLVAADQDFGTCLELSKTVTTQKLRYIWKTHMSPGCYLRVSARVKAIAGPLPTLQVAAWAGQPGDTHVSGVDELGLSTTLTDYGDIVTITAIVGSGSRTGVDMIWGTVPTYGHFGLNLTGPDGGVVRIEDIHIEDITSAFHRKMLGLVDVVDFGAVGDGVTDDATAFNKADNAANGATVLVPAGTYFLGSTVTMQSDTRFEGNVTMPDNAILALAQNYDFASYARAFGNEELAFKKAFQALLNFSDHDTLDLNGREITLSGPVDLHAAVGNKDTYKTRRVVRNGRFVASNSTSWDDSTVTSSASYSSSNNKRLTNVTNIASIKPGSLVTGNGVGREIYVTDVDVSASTASLSLSLYGAPSSQTYTFKRFKYMLDFSGFTSFSNFVLDNINFGCSGKCSAVLLSPDGSIFQVRESYFDKPKDRGISSPGAGCQGMILDRNQFISNEGSLTASSRQSIGFNVTANDAKIRDNRAPFFRHFGVIAGAGTLISGNHFFQGDPSSSTSRTAGLVISHTSPKTSIVGNYIDNSWLEWTSEHSSNAQTGSKFQELSITSNHFTANDVATWFSWIRIKPYGPNHSIDGFIVTGNVFKKLFGSTITRAESVDTSFANLDHAQTKNLVFCENTFENVINKSCNPANVKITQTSLSSAWTIGLGARMPFAGHTRAVTSLVPQGPITSSFGALATQPYASVSQGSSKNQIKLNWSAPAQGSVWVTVHSSEPL